ncbi:SCA7, zinc-binding domain-containing protein [Phlyctochytrium arcticum]|nr:SCA7, zinc-binding domain-containing protein [Phlyctochytrium arcticum]
MSLLTGKQHLTWTSLRDSLGLPDAVPALEVDDPSFSISPTTTTSTTHHTHPTPSPGTTTHDQFGSPPIDAYIFGMAPADPTVLVSCNVCSRVVLQTAFAEHSKSCSVIPKTETKAATPSSSSSTTIKLNSKKRKKADDSISITHSSGTPFKAERTDKPSSSSFESQPSLFPPASTPNKIEKSADKVDRPTSKMSKAARNIKIATGPIDLDKQCGVRLDNGALCTRSITCKIHSVGAKRGVAGRSQQYDILFQEHQQRNLGRALKAGDPRAGNTPLKSSIPSRSSSTSNVPPLLAASTPNPFIDPEKPLTKDEEADLVFSAIRVHRPQPIVGVQSDVSAVGVVWAFKRRQALMNAFMGQPV